MEDKKITMPAVALRGLTILPGMVQHFDISREKSIRAIETAMMGNQKVYLVTQRHPEQETPAVADLYQMGTISQIKQLVKMPGGIIRVMVEGDKRAALLTLFEEGRIWKLRSRKQPMQEEQAYRHCEGSHEPDRQGKIRGIRKRESEGCERFYRKSSCDHGSGAASDPGQQMISVGFCCEAGDAGV